MYPRAWNRACMALFWARKRASYDLSMTKQLKEGRGLHVLEDFAFKPTIDKKSPSRNYIFLILFPFIIPFVAIPIIGYQIHNNQLPSALSRPISKCQCDPPLYYLRTITLLTPTGNSKEAASAAASNSPSTATPPSPTSSVPAASAAKSAATTAPSISAP